MGIVTQSEEPPPGLLGHVIRSAGYELHLGQTAGMDMDYGSDGPPIGFCAAQLHRYATGTSRCGGRVVLEHLNEGHVPKSHDIRCQVLIDVQCSQTIKLGLLIGPTLLCLVHEQHAFSDIPVVVIVVGQ